MGYQSTDEGVTGYRTPVASNVDTASDDPKEFSMELHTDGAYYTSYPRKVLQILLNSLLGKMYQR